MSEIHLATPSWDGMFIYAAVALTSAIVIKYIYRLTLHPLAVFPGPRLAGATRLYGAYIDLWSGDSYVKSFPALHEKYGPIVRLWPNQLHIADIEAYNQIFRIGTKFPKHAPFYANPTLTGGFVADPNALPRRHMFGPNFNTEAVRRAESRIAQCQDRFFHKLEIYAQASRPVNMTAALKCLMVDGVTDFIYSKPYGALDADDFRSDILKPMYDFTKMMQWPIYFPRLFGVIFRLMNLLPMWALEKSFPALVTQRNFVQICHDQMTYLASCPPGKERPASVFDTIFNPNLEKGQYSPPISHLAADAFTFVVAGTDTSSRTVVVALFNLLAGSPEMLQRLKSELRGVIPNSDKIVKWSALEKVPYLYAVIKESLRLGFGVPGRLPRVVPEGGATFCGKKIPANTVVSSCIYVHNMNPTVFPDPERFQPERWLEGDPSLDRHLCSFSRGSRGCIGINLTNCELYITLACLLRRYDLELYQTTKEDMEWKDSFAPMSKGPLRVLLKKVEE